MQIYRITLRRGILISQNKNGQAEPGKKGSKLRLLACVGGRRGSSREEGAGVAKKPLIVYVKGRSIDGFVYSEEGNRSMMDGRMSDESAARWGSWGKKDTLGQWSLLRELCLFHR